MTARDALPFDFRLANCDGLAHVTRDRGDTWSLCGTPTNRRAPDRAAPCSTCLERAAEQLAS